MAWKNGFYYRNRRQDGRVETEYIGGGPTAELIAQLDAMERQQRDAERAALKRQAAADAELDAEIEAVGAVLAAVVAAELLIVGYHKYDRRWRRWRRCK